MTQRRVRRKDVFCSREAEGDARPAAGHTVKPRIAPELVDGRPGPFARVGVGVPAIRDTTATRHCNQQLEDTTGGCYIDISRG